MPQLKSDSIWPGKIKASALHFVITCFVVGLTAILVFKYWYPSPYAQLLGGEKLFVLVAVCDLVLGPLLTLVIFNNNKTKRALFLDYSVIVSIQLAALIYGLISTANARPVVQSFTVDRFDIVSASEIPDIEFEKALPPYNKRSWVGPILVWAKQPTDPSALSKITTESLETGLDLQHRPSFYQPYELARALVISKSKSLQDLPNKSSQLQMAIALQQQKHNLRSEDIRWLLTKHKKGFATALVHASQGTLLAYLPFDPY